MSGIFILFSFSTLEGNPYIKRELVGHRSEMKVAAMRSEQNTPLKLNREIIVPSPPLYVLDVGFIE